MERRASVRLRWPSPRRVLPAGTAASAAYLAEQALDRKLLPNRYDDLVLWGGLIARHPRRQRMLGLAIHWCVGLSLAAAFDALEPSMPRLPRWIAGAVFVQLENTALFPSVALINRVHPAVRRGQLPSLWTWTYFWVEVARHLAYGVTLGLFPQAPSGRMSQ